MDWIRGKLKGPDTPYPGSLVRLVTPEDCYTKATVFQSASLFIAPNELIIKNDEFDPEQDQLEQMAFAIPPDCQLVHYSILSDHQHVYCIKWLNQSSQSRQDLFYAFEFESFSSYTKFSEILSQSHRIIDEGMHDPNLRLRNQKLAHSSLSVTTRVIPSNITKAQLKPVGDPEAEQMSIRSLNFKRIALQSLSQLYSSDSILFMTPADLYLLGPNLSVPLLTDRGLAFLIIRHPEFKMSLDLVREGSIVMRILINTYFFIKVDCENKHVSWVENVNENERRTWRAEVLDDVDNLEGIINLAKYEVERKVAAVEISEEDQAWIKGESKRKEEAKCEGGKEEKVERMEVDFQGSQGIEEDDEIFDSVSSWTGNNVYVSRKGKVAIYTGNDNTIQRASVIPLKLTPYQLLLQMQDTKLLLLPSSTSNIIYNFDITRQQIIEEYKLKDQVLQMAPVTKLSPLENSAEFVGISQQSLFRVDPRTEGKIVSEFKYVSNPEFSCVATTGLGGIAVGSKKGDIRLYRDAGKKSTTNFPGLGHPVKSIDSTKDGAWLIATTDTYIMVIQTMFESELAYNKALARKRKPPKKLQIDPEDIEKYQLTSINFTPARFNVNSSCEETAIITSTGNLLIIWDFSSIKSGRLSEYCVKVMDKPVIKNEFRFGEENAIVTHQTSVKLQTSRWNMRAT